MLHGCEENLGDLTAQALFRAIPTKMPDEGSPAAAEPTQDSKGRAFMCAHNTRFDHARTALALACETIVD